MRTGNRRECGGFTYLALLFAVAVMGVALAGAGQVWVTAAKREKERELLFIGNQYREAIGRYYQNSPGVKQLPAKLEDMVEDKRFPTPKRYLRKIYVDPMTGSREWGLVVEQGRIVGVHSRSKERPLKTGNFSKADTAFANAETYAAWRFVFQAAEGGIAGTTPGPGVPPGAGSPAGIDAPAGMETPPGIGAPAGTPSVFGAPAGSAPGVNPAPGRGSAAEVPAAAPR